MTPTRRLARLFLPVLLGLSSFVLPGRAQGPRSSRFAFADTTLLRDTLNLHFGGLFETADSLQMLPDSLRAQMIRFRLPMFRLIAMADSMNVPVDSVGAVILRESYNPLSFVAGAKPRTTFKYTSSYDIQRTATVWINGADYTMLRGPLLLRNGTNIRMDRSTAGGRLSLRQDRSSISEMNWRLSPDLSVGGRASLSGFDNRTPGALGDEGETKHEFQFSTRTRRALVKNRRTDLSSELNVLGGLLDLKNFSQLKRGLSGDMNGRLRLTRGAWLSHDLNGGVNGNLSRTRRPSAENTLRTSDFSANFRGTLQAFQQSRVGLNVNYALRNTRVETPTDSSTVNQFLTANATVEATLRLRLDNDRYLNLTANAGKNRSLSGTRFDNGVRAQMRWVIGPWQLDGDYADLLGDSRFPVRAARAGGYDEKQDNRNANATLTRPIGRYITAKLSSGISLSQIRSRATAIDASPSTPRDNYRQSYKVETFYNPSERANTAVALDVSLSRSINLPALSTGNNTDTRGYRAEWRWSYRMLRGLTASQSNTVQANYEFFPFDSRRNGLTLDFNSLTTLAAVLTPRLTLDVTHNARQQPRGDWRTLSDGSGALVPSDEQLDYTLRSRVTWAPARTVSLTLTPEYLASDRTGTSNGLEAPTRQSRRLNLSGGANLNLTVARRGQLTGSISRTFSADRNTSFKVGIPQPSAVVEQDFWNGSLQLSWEL